jgi:hypothetical protein
MHLVAFSEKPLCLTDVLTATMRADGVSTGLGTDDNGGGGPDFGSDEFLSLMFNNFCIERPKQRRLVPAWDLGIVLKALHFHRLNL